MIKLSDIRELAIKQENEFEELLLKYLSQQNIQKEDISRDSLKNQIQENINSNNVDKTLELLEVYKSNFNEDLSYNLMSGIIYMVNGNLDLAYEFFSNGYSIDENNVDVLYNLGYLGELIGDLDLSIHYYEKCLENADTLDLVDELESKLKALTNRNEYVKEPIVLTYGLCIEESKLFVGNNKVVSLVVNNEYKEQNVYEKENITVYEVQESKINELFNYLLRNNPNSLIIFNSVDNSRIVEQVKENHKVGYFVSQNHYLENINYYRNSINLYNENAMLNKCDYIFTGNIITYDFKKFVENRENVYLLDNKIGYSCTIDFVLNSFDEEIYNQELKNYLQTLDNEYDKSYYLIASEFNNIENLKQVSSYIFEKYNTLEMYYIYISILRRNKEFLNIINIMLHSDFCRDEFKGELVYLNALNIDNLIEFMIELSLKNYNLVDKFIDEEYKLYKLAAYTFELNNKEKSYELYNILLDETNEFHSSVILNRNIFNYLYLNGDKNYIKYEKNYEEMLSEILKED